MNNKSDIYEQLWQQLYHGSDINEIRQALKKLEELKASNELSIKKIYELQVHGFRALRELTVKDPDAAKGLILEDLFPQCLLTYTDAEVNIELHKLRDCLVDWLNQYPEDVYQDIRDRVLDRLYTHLASSEPQVACGIISRIGYRTDKAVETLWDIVSKNDNKIGDTALATITRLGVPFDQRKALLSELKKRANSRYNRSLVSALTQLANPASIKVIYRWLTSDKYKLKAIDISLIFNVFIAILNAKSDDQALQNEVWQCLINLANERPDEFSHRFYMGKIIPNCNSALVVPTMFEWLGKENEERKNLAWRRYLVGLRLEKSVRPIQLKGWKNSLTKEAVELLKQDACQDTGNDSRSTTQEYMIKKKAWETLLRAGHADALNWFDEAVTNETGRFLQKEIIELFALFRFEPLPEIVIKWVTERYDESSADKDSREFVRRMAAVRMVRSTASKETFNALLGFGFTYQGELLKQLTDALAEVAIHLINKDNYSIIEEIVEVVINCKEKHQRVAAAYTLESIASIFPSLVSKHVEKIIPILYDTERENYERGTLINVLGNLKDWEVPDKLLQDIKVWSHQSDKWIGSSSLNVLARNEHLHNDHNLLNEVLHLQQADSKWDLISDIKLSKWKSYIIGLLYYYHPQTFLPAIVSLLKHYDWLYVNQVIEWLYSSHGKPEQLPLPKEIKDVIIQRIHERQSDFYSEIEMFDVLTKLAPEDLAQESWENVWDNWLPESRTALADALGKAKLDPVSRDKAISHLQLLTRDGQYAVRRAAYRGLARQSMDALYRLCLSWSIAPTVELRRRAAEACGWLDRGSNEDRLEDFKELYQKLVSDQEKSVREIAKQTWEESRKRSWAEQYLSIVMSVEGKNNEEILEVWCYGEALVRIGDDSCIQTLREHLVNDSHPPNVRYWIQKIIKRMQENWRKETQSWPDPWFAWEGAIEKGRGKIQISKDNMRDIHYSIWSQPASVSSGQHKWGGAIWHIPLIELGERMIRLEDGRRGRIIITKSSTDIAIFLGNGPYPK